jgi:hypothetical protein
MLSYVSCQKREANQIEEPMYPTYIATLWEKVTVNVTYLPTNGGKKCLVNAREDLLG